VGGRRGMALGRVNRAASLKPRFCLRTALPNKCVKCRRRASAIDVAPIRHRLPGKTNRSSILAPYAHVNPHMCAEHLGCEWRLATFAFRILLPGS